MKIDPPWRKFSQSLLFVVWKWYVLALISGIVNLHTCTRFENQTRKVHLTKSVARHEEGDDTQSNVVEASEDTLLPLRRPAFLHDWLFSVLFTFSRKSKGNHTAMFLEAKTNFVPTYSSWNIMEHAPCGCGFTGNKYYSTAMPVFGEKSSGSSQFLPELSVSAVAVHSRAKRSVPGEKKLPKLEFNSQFSRLWNQNMQCWFLVAVGSIERNEGPLLFATVTSAGRPVTQYV